MKEVFVRDVTEEIYDSVRTLYNNNNYIGIEHYGEKYFMTCVKDLLYIAVRPKGWNTIHPEVDRFFVFNTKSELFAWMSEE